MERVVMKKLIVFLFLVPTFLGAEVGLIPAGQSMWWISKRIGETADVIDSKLDGISATCEAMVLSSSDISGGTITISSAGLYCLSEDVTADISVETSCVSLNINNRTVTGLVTVGNSSADCELFNGFIDSPVNSSSTSATYAVTIESGTSRVLLNDLTITGGNGSGATGITGHSGVSGVTVQGDNVMIRNCEVHGGNGDDGSNAGGAGGHGIEISGATDVLMRNCVMQSGDGGPSNTTGGDGGDGILLKSGAARVEIDGCIIIATGTGGDGVSVGGVGGDGISIDSSCVDVAVHDCIIRNTGAGENGDGKAIDDNVAAGTSESIIYRNVAHNIANALRYDFRAIGVEGGVSMTNPPTNIPRANQFINFYM